MTSYLCAYGANVSNAFPGLLHIIYAVRLKMIVHVFSYILMSIFIGCQIMQHMWAWPFLEPVDVKGLNLLHYYEVKLLVFIFQIWHFK